MLTLGFSPCPNDTFIFDALIHNKIDTEGLTFDVFLDDVETLNRKALRTELDITKLSFHAFAYVTNNYVLLDAGSALGFGVGPLLISKKKAGGWKQEAGSEQSLVSNRQSAIGIWQLAILTILTIQAPAHIRRPFLPLKTAHSKGITS